MDRFFKVEISQYTATEKVASKCNDITFQNKAAFIVTVNNCPIAAGGELKISGNRNEIDVTEYSLNFGTNTGGVVYVIRKYYI